MVLKKKSISVEVPFIDSIIEISAVDLQKLDKKAIKLDLTRMLHGRSTEATFMISVNDGKATAELKKLVLLPFYIQRAMRKGISYVEDSFLCETSDKNLIIKPFLITRNKVHRAVRNALKIKAREIIKECCANRQAFDIFSSIASGKFQKELALKLKKIYPLSFCEIRIAEIEKAKK